VDTSSAQSTVVTSLAITAAIVATRQAQDGSLDAVRLGIGFTLSAVGLTVLAGPAPRLAASLAVLVAVGTVLSQTAVIDAVSARVAGK